MASLFSGCSVCRLNEGMIDCMMQRGEFILDRRDTDNYRFFPIWKIDSPRLLQKYEAYEQNGRILHRAVCTVRMNIDTTSLASVVLVGLAVMNYRLD